MTMINKLLECIFGKKKHPLEELPIQTGNPKCRTCGSTTWSAANLDPEMHWLKADVIECSDCVGIEKCGPR